jgi:hypothetical protein
MTPHDDENDGRPAWGLRDDAFDDNLRSQNPSRPKKPPQDPLDDAEEIDGVESLEDVAVPDDDPPRRGRGPARLSANPNGAFKNSRMTQTETALRTADNLAKCPLIIHDVLVTIAGFEAKRRKGPEFPVMRTMTKWGYVREPGNHEPGAWNGLYAKAGQPKRILLNFDRSNGHMLTRLATGQRLVVFMTAGSLAPTKSSTESKQLSSAIGRVSRWANGTPEDQFAVSVPRTERFRSLVAEAKEADGVKRLRLIFLLVDRGGGFSGLPEP